MGREKPNYGGKTHENTVHIRVGDRRSSDKICDQISDGILDALLAIDPNSRCACETTAEPGAVHIMGEITTAATVNYIEIARQIIREIGYTKPEYGFDADTCEISCSLHTQSADIAQGVDMALEAKEAIDADGLGAGDRV